MDSAWWTLGTGVVFIFAAMLSMLRQSGKLSGAKLWWEVYLQELNNPVALSMEAAPRVQRARQLANETIKMLIIAQPGETMYGRIKN